jgi:hypothetical protein
LLGSKLKRPAGSGLLKLELPTNGMEIAAPTVVSNASRVQTLPGNCPRHFPDADLVVWQVQRRVGVLPEYFKRYFSFTQTRFGKSEGFA